MAKKAVKKAAKTKTTKKTPTKETFGGAHIASNPPSAVAKADIQSVNLTLTFEEAMRLQVAIQAGILEMNSYDRSKTAAKSKGLNLCYYPESNRITVSIRGIAKKNR